MTIQSIQQLRSTPSDVQPTPVSLSLIRDFELRYLDEIVEMSPTSQRLLCFIALQGRPIRRTQVSGSLWLDSTDDRASASLRSALWRVPAPGGVPVIGASSTHLWLCPHVQVDLTSLVERALAVLDGRGADTLDVPGELCAFSEDVLAGWYDDWVIMQRESFRQLRLHALERLGERLLDAGRYVDALQVGLAAVAGEPLRESAHRLLVRAHLCEGNVTEAIRQYRVYSRLIADELHTEPSVAMQQMLSQWLRPREPVGSVATLVGGGVPGPGAGRRIPLPARNPRL